MQWKKVKIGNFVTFKDKEKVTNCIIFRSRANELPQVRQRTERYADLKIKTIDKPRNISFNKLKSYGNKDLPKEPLHMSEKSIVFEEHSQDSPMMKVNIKKKKKVSSKQLYRLPDIHQSVLTHRNDLSFWDDQL
jgi:hypothetical protein